MPYPSNPTRLRLRHRPAPKGTITLLDAMADEHLFAPWFRDASTWMAWRVFLRALFGLPMARSERAIYTKHTGRDSTPKAQAREAWLIVGRRGGKSFITALVAVFLACFRDYRRYLAPGEVATVMVLAADRKQARVIMRYVSALLERVPMLARMIVRSGMESVDLNNSVCIEIHTASWRSTRGYTVCACLADEVAFWRSDDSANPDREILDAIRPAMSTIPGALLLGISSPYARRGALWDAYDQHYGEDGDVLVWQAPSADMNPTIPERIIASAYEDDPASAAAEYGAQFRSDIESFLQGDWISAAVAEGVHEIAPEAGISYMAFTDPSGGSQDSYTLGIAHVEGKRLILDVCRARRSPLDPKAVTAEFAKVVKEYGCGRVVGDRYSAEWVVSAWREHGVHYEPSTRSKSEIYLEALPLFATGAVQLLDHRALLNELRQLERRTGSTKDVIDHPPRGHDDCANAACGALVLAVRPSAVDGDFISDTDRQSKAENRTALAERIVELGYSGQPSEFDQWDSGPFSD